MPFMSLNYVSDNAGNPIAVQIPIEDWVRIKDKYPDVDDFGSDVPEWQKEIVGQRLNSIEEDASHVRSIDDLFDEPDNS